MLNVDLLSDRMARASLQRRRSEEAERKERIFQDKIRTIGVDKEALDTQVEEKKKQQIEAEEKQNAKDANMLQNGKLACLLHSRQVKEQRAMEQAVVNQWRGHQQTCSQRELDLNGPDGCRKTKPADVQMMPPGLVGEDPDGASRRQRQKEQLRDWLTQQQSEQAAERHQRKLEEQCSDRSMVEMDHKALQLQSIDMERRKGAAVATKEYNLAKVEERRRLRITVDAEPSLGMVGMLSHCSSSERTARTASVGQIIQFQKCQVEEKKRMEMEQRKEEEQYDRVRIDSARTALLIERQQARLNKQMRRHLDSTNVELAQTHKQEKPDIERGHIDESFFSKFNTCSR